MQICPMINQEEVQPISQEEMKEQTPTANKSEFSSEDNAVKEDQDDDSSEENTVSDRAKEFVI